MPGLEGGLDSLIHDVLVFVITGCLALYGLRALVELLKRSRPDLAIGRAVAAAVAIRVLGSFGITLTGFASTLRGGDEASYLFISGQLAESPFLSPQWIDAVGQELHTVVGALQLVLLDAPPTSIRLAMTGIAVAGMVLLAASAYDLAGPRAAWLGMWVLAFEPSNIFFTGIYNKESLMLLASGLVVFGGTRLWRRGRADALVPIALGCAVALATRVYAGGFLIAAAALLVGHAALQRRGGPLTSIGLASVLAGVAFVAVPIAIEASDQESLEKEIQIAQDANANDESNLALEEVDFSTRGAIVTNLPIRVRDLILRPYPWQVANTSQALGLIGTIAALSILFILIREARARRGRLWADAAPILYPLISLLIAYSIAVGNAGTGFRYRIHLVALAIILLLVLRERRLQRDGECQAPPVYVRPPQQSFTADP